MAKRKVKKIEDWRAAAGAFSYGIGVDHYDGYEKDFLDEKTAKAAAQMSANEYQRVYYVWALDAYYNILETVYTANPHKKLKV
jgi:hypothetical protein